MFAHLFKFNENHDPATGRFSESGGGTSFGKSSASFSKTANSLYKEQKVKDWEKLDYLSRLGPNTYFGSSRSFDMNRYLRTGSAGGFNKDPSVSNWVENTNKAFNGFGVTLKDGTEVYRAVRGDFAKVLDGMKAGESFVDKGFVSTSGGFNLDGFGESIMQITVKGSPKAMLYKGENEVLFQPGRKFTFRGKSVGKGKDKGLTFYRVELE